MPGGMRGSLDFPIRTFALFAALSMLAPGGTLAKASSLTVVKPLIACNDLLKLDLGYLKEAPARA
jgi:hypothetical protein